MFEKKKYAKEYHQKHKLELKQCHKEYYQKHKDKLKENQRN